MIRFFNLSPILTYTVQLRFKSIQSNSKIVKECLPAVREFDPLPGSLPNSLPKVFPSHSLPSTLKILQSGAKDLWCHAWCLGPPSGAWVPILPPDPFLKWYCKQPSPLGPHLLKSRGVPLSQNQKYPPNSPCFCLSWQAT